jgi:hypothetical protein
VTITLLNQNQTKTLNNSVIPKVGFDVKINVLAKTNVSAVNKLNASDVRRERAA